MPTSGPRFLFAGAESRTHFANGACDWSRASLGRRPYACWETCLHSFTYNLVEYVSEHAETTVVRNTATLAAVRDADPDSPFVLYQTGGFGIEPISYILGPDAPTVAGVVRDVV